MDFLKSAVASAIAKSSSIPYTIGDKVDNNQSIWNLHNGTKREDGSLCSVFVFDVNTNKAALPPVPLARNATKKLRTIRHPGVIKVLDVIENETTIYLVTERVTPLSWNIKRKSLSEETIKWGLHSVATTLKFINADAASVHGNIRVSSIYTSESGEWKLGGFEILSSMNDDEALIYKFGNLVPDSGRYAPPEVAANGWAAIKKAPLHAADAYGLGELIFEAFNGVFMGTDQLPSPRSIPAVLAPSYKRLINANPKLRLSAAHFLDQGKKTGGFFETPLISITQSADNLGLMNPEERDAFLEELEKLSDDFPEDFFKMKILPELLKSVEFGGGGPSVFGAIMKISLTMSDDEFESRLTPTVLRLFASPDRALRVCLLDNMPLMIERLSQKDVNGRIWPAMTTGFTDTAPVVREQTVKAVLTVIPKLSDRTINGELLRFLAKTANDEQPGIRTNTTICLGKIARNLGIGSRSKVLIAAFTRSLRDPFVHGRSAALMALNATMDLFSEDDCATKLLPALSASLIDKEKIVRDQANKTFDAYLQRIRKYAMTLPETALPPDAAPGSTQQTAARMGNQNDTSWAGWAISSFTNKLTAAKGEMQTAPTNGVTSPPQSLPASGRTTPSILPAAERARTVRAPVTQPLPKPEPEPEVDLLEEQEDTLDAWGTMDDDEDSFFDAPRTKATPAIKPATAFDDGGEPDFAGWLAAQSQAKRGVKATPKGLTKASATNGAAARPPTGRTISADHPAAGAKAAAKAATKTAAAPVKKEAPRAKAPEAAADDDWGDAWD